MGGAESEGMVLYAHALPMSKYKDGPNPSAVSFYGTTESFPVASSKHTNNMVYSRVYKLPTGDSDPNRRTSGKNC